ncbi:MAG TPA: GAF domain-containing protein [Terriglobales bacterium]|jgi:ribosomal protein S10|nr:GAF domain-containing protein [Terriglobales bacterium]
MIFEKFELPEGEACTVEKVAADLARIFGVRRHEVAILSLHGQILRFLYPAELKSAGAIPLSSHAVAAQTAKTKRADLFNNFTMRRHSRLFELVSLEQEAEKNRQDTQIIQKLMTAPIVDRHGEILGVVQISRKGITPNAAGADFTPEELHQLEYAARIVATVMPLLNSSEPWAQVAPQPQVTTR